MQRILKDALESASVVWRYFIRLGTAILLVRPAFWAANDLMGHVPHSVLIDIFVYILFMLFCVAVHELGHALAGILAGYRIHMIAVAAFGYRPAARKFQYIFLSETGDFGGYVFGTTPTLENWVRRDALFTAGGPLANFVFSGGMFLLAGSGMGDAIKGTAANLAIMSLVIGVQSLIPQSWNSGRSRSDGALLLDLIKGKVMSAEDLRASLLRGLEVDCMDALLWDDGVVAQIESGDVEEGYRALRDHMLLHRYFAVGDLQKALRLLERSEGAKTGKEPGLAIEYAHLVALLNNDAARGAAALRTVPEHARKTFNFWRAQAVVHSGEGEREAAILAAGNARRIALEEGAGLDHDDAALLTAIEQGKPLPREWRHRAAA